jgi:hypothetical protein
MELNGIYIDEFYFWAAWVLFAFEIIILMSRQVANGIIDFISNYWPLNLDNHTPHYWFKAPTGTVK